MGVNDMDIVEFVEKVCEFSRLFVIYSSNHTIKFFNMEPYTIRV